MCSPSCIIFGAKNLSKEEVRGKRVIEVGAYDANGGLRPLIESWEPSEYVGVDIEMGPGVDVVCNAEDLAERFGEESFDVVVSTELIEHVRDWKRVISNIKRICKQNGIMVLTTRSYGYGYHGYPHDYWRYELEDLKYIFSDCEDLILEKDYRCPGVFLRARKPQGFAEKDLSDYKLYSLCVDKRISAISENDLRSLHYRRLLVKDRARNFILNFIYKVGGYVSSKI